MKNLQCGITDEAGVDLSTQIRAARELGWTHLELRSVQVPGFPAANVHDISDEAFAKLVETLGAADMRVYAFGSAIANGGKDIRKPFDACRHEALRAAVRLPQLGCRFIRVMSYPILHGEHDQREEERFRRLREIVRIFADSGATVLHENCANYGGMGWPYTLRLLENVPGLRLVFDTGNCVFDLDYRKPEPRPRQSAWEFYEHVREHVVHLHVKDGRLGSAHEHHHTYPGEGAGEVRRVLRDLLARGYPGAFSIEPHLGVAPEFLNLPIEDGRYRTFVAYGRKLNALVEELLPVAMARN